VDDRGTVPVLPAVPARVAARPRTRPRQPKRRAMDPRRRPRPDLRVRRPLGQRKGPERVRRQTRPPPARPRRLRRRTPARPERPLPPRSGAAVAAAGAGEAAEVHARRTRTVVRRSTSTPATGRHWTRRRTRSEKTPCPTARSRRPRVVHGSVGVGEAPAPRSGRRTVRVTDPRNPSPIRRRPAEPGPGRTRSRSRREVPREGCVPAARAPVASAEGAAAARTRSSSRGSPTR
jgi:hypothetical protein